MPGEVDPASVTFGVPRSWVLAQRVVALRQAPSGCGLGLSQPGPCSAQAPAWLCSNSTWLTLQGSSWLGAHWIPGCWVAMHRELQGCRQLLPWHLLQPACCMVCRGGEELLVKWEGLGYDELSWERRASLKDVDAKIAAFKGQQSIATKVTLLLPGPELCSEC